MFASRVVLGLLFSGLAATQYAPPPPAWLTGQITEDGTCGPETALGWVCTPTWGACCGANGQCGRKNAFCGDGCQQGYGNCNAPPWTGTPSPDGSCGGTNLYNCTGSAFGACCSSDGRCGDSTGHCGTGCQSLFGTCTASNTTVDGSCGPSTGNKTCTGGTFGNCCSAGGWCGNTTDHCGAGCQSGFGTCNGGSDTISTDGKCGSNGKTCTGSAFGTCCSSSGNCGNTTAHCGAGCQSSFGSGCTSGSGSISTDGACGANGKMCSGSGFGNCCSSGGYCGNTTDHCGAGCQSLFGNCTTPDPYQPQQPGIIASCNRYSFVKAGNSCESISAKYAITQAQFISWNPSAGSGCTGLWAAHWVCVGVLPSPIQSPVHTNCSKHHQVASSSTTCDAIVERYGLKLSDFMGWNPSINSACSNLKPGYYTCVAITPSPIQNPVHEFCNKYHKSASSSTTCQAIADYNGISLSDFNKWNPGIDAGCTNLKVGGYTCVGVTPSPIQIPVTSNCDKYHQVASSSTTCQAIANYNKISLSDFMKWNPGIDTSCSNLKVSWYVCVHVPGAAVLEQR